MPHPISTITTKHHSLERSLFSFFLSVRTGALGSEVIVQCPLKKKVANAEEKKRQEEVGERGQRVFCGVEGGERVLDPAVSARGTHFAGAQGVLSDGRTATAVFRNTSRPVYCLGAWVSALSSPPTPPTPTNTAPSGMVHAASLAYRSRTPLKLAPLEPDGILNRINFS